MLTSPPPGSTRSSPDPWVFQSFTHRPPDGQVADRLADELRANGVYILRLKDTKPLASDLISDHIDAHLLSASSILTVWSERAAASPWVTRERLEAKRRGLKECLVMFQKCALPSDWPMLEGRPNAIYYELKGVRLKPPYRGQHGQMVPNVGRFDPKSLKEVVRQIVGFAVREAMLRQSLGP